MSEKSTTGRLCAEQSKKVVEQFSTYASSSSAVVQIQKDSQPDAGLPAYLDGQAFIGGFVEHLKDAGEDPSAAMAMLSHILEIASYVRAGGAKSCLYRLETGCSISPTDFYDTLSEQLRFVYQGGKLVSLGTSGSTTVPVEAASSSKANSSVSLLQKLRAVSEADEEIVKQLETKIESSLLSVAQKLEWLTQDSSS